MLGSGELTVTFVSCLLGAIAMGLSCGTGCSPAITLFLSSYVVRYQGDTRKSLVAFGQFFLGKGSAVLLVCLAAALTGTAILDSNGYLGKYSLSFLLPLFLLITGGWMVAELLRSRGECGDCHGHCGEHTHKLLNGKKRKKAGEAAPIAGGFFYGLTPCAPLIILAGYALTMNPGKAMILAVLFSIASACSPLLLMLLFMKLVVSRMQEEVPKLLSGLRWVLSFAVCILGAYLLVRCAMGNPATITA